MNSVEKNIKINKWIEKNVATPNLIDIKRSRYTSIKELDGYMRYLVDKAISDRCYSSKTPVIDIASSILQRSKRIFETWYLVRGLKNEQKT